MKPAKTNENIKETQEMPCEKSELFCADCGRLMLYHPALEKYICLCCSDEAPQSNYDLEPYTGSDGL